MKRANSPFPADISGPNNPIKAILADDQSAITHLYDLYRGQFIAYATRQFNLEKQDAVEIYQESFISLHSNVKSGKLVELNSSLKTYLFGVGRNKILNRLRDDKSRRWEQINDRLSDFNHADDEWSLKKEIIYGTIINMKEPCSTVLHMYYWERRSMKEIVGRMNYKTQQVARNKKAACMRRLKTVIINTFRAEGLI